MSAPKTRRSITDLLDDYRHKGIKEPLENLIKAWRGIQALPPGDPNSFFSLGGLHGEPFRGKGATDPTWWGGYCQHATVLFPVWHRAYLANLEKALQSIEGCADVTLPFWDECSQDSKDHGVPWIFTQENFPSDSKDPNPLYSYKFPVGITEDPSVNSGSWNYSKPAGYCTVRYPLSGLDDPAAKAHNAQFPDAATCTMLLNGNIMTWLSGKFILEGNPLGEIDHKFEACLDAPSYTLFSNTTSAGAWNDKNPHGTRIVPLEDPHNYMHLAVGGYEWPGPDPFSADLIPGANGDMGENNTAGLDPIFFFHHCFIDYAFWIWQRRHGATDSFDIDSSDPGASYNPPESLPPAGGEQGQSLSMDTPLDPFLKLDRSGPFTARDCINIEKQLGYTYGHGSLDAHAAPPARALAAMARPAGRRLRVSGINRAKIPGSFLISAYVTVEGKRQYIGTHPVLSRWNVEGCMNCQTHLEAKAHFVLPPGLENATAAKNLVHVEVRTHTGRFGDRPQTLAAATGARTAATAPFKMEIL